MPEATTTTVDHGAILLRQVGDGFYLTNRGVILLIGMWVILAVLIMATGMNRSK